ncbi:MAG TPA: DUF3365 domain-containing protein [Bacteroidales bacterium]|nr:DUF3365 domain-containing protein [Bacteroidales bacterium]
MRPLKIIFVIFIISCILTSCDEAQKSTGSEKPQHYYPDSLANQIREQGRGIAKASFQALSAALLSAIEKGGVPHALQFCNEKALPITDSMAMIYNVKIKRISAKNRNPENVADKEQLQLMEHMQKQIAAYGSAKDTVVHTEQDELAYYAPIIVAAPCLQCHGAENNDIKPENLALIKKFYPGDKATGYAIGDLRGLWFLRFKK